MINTWILKSLIFCYTLSQKKDEAESKRRIQLAQERKPAATAEANRARHHHHGKISTVLKIYFEQ